MEHHEPREGGFDPADFVSVAMVAAALDDDWQVEVASAAPGRPGGWRGAHHTEDEVLAPAQAPLSDQVTTVSAGSSRRSGRSVSTSTARTATSATATSRLVTEHRAVAVHADVEERIGVPAVIAPITSV